MTDPIIEIIAMFMGRALFYSCFIGLVTRCGNILVRAFSGKENFL